MLTGSLERVAAFDTDVFLKLVTVLDNSSTQQQQQQQAASPNNQLIDYPVNKKSSQSNFEKFTNPELFYLCFPRTSDPGESCKLSIDPN